MSPAERRLVQVRLAEDVGEADRDSTEATFVFLAHYSEVQLSTAANRIFEGFKLAIRDVKVWMFMFMSCAQSLGLSFVNFFPT